MTDDADCVPYPCPPPIPLGDWPDSHERLEIPTHLHDFDAGALCVRHAQGHAQGHAHGPGAEAISDHVWLQWCARVGDVLVCAYHHEPMGDFVALLRSGDGRALKGLKIAPPRHVRWDDDIERRRAWASATAIAAADELRARPPADAEPPAEAEAWLRQQLDGLGRKRPT